MFWVLSFVIQITSIVWGVVVLNKDGDKIFGAFLLGIKILNIIALTVLITLMIKTTHRSENAPRQGLTMG
tara:strand:- start:2444 stop:2653 length:210 start_codon:yes stop_codon:yes gene_type:complete